MLEEQTKLLQGDLRSLSTRTHSKAPAIAPPTYPWKTRLLVPALLLLGLLSTLAVAAGEALWPARAVRVVPVVVKAATPQERPTTGAAGGGGGGGGGAVVAQAAGWVEADPYALSVTSLADGVVEEVLVLEGEAVKKGQVVARLVDDDAQLSLAKAEAELASRSAELTAAQQEWEHPVELDRSLAEAEAMLAETLAEVDQLAAEVAADVARRDELAEQLERTRQSYESGAATELELVTAQHQHAAQEADLAATQARGPVLEAQRRQREASLAAARKNRELRIDDARSLAAAEAAVALTEAERDEAALRLARMEVRSPADGLVLSRHIEPGAKLMLAMDDPLSSTTVRLYDPEKLQVRVDVPLADAAKVGVGMAAQVTVDVLPDQVFEGEVTRIVQEADVAKNTLQVKVAIRDPSPQLKPEMLARVRFLAPGGSTAAGSEGSAHVVFAPEELIVSDGATATVWVADRRENVARRREIQIGTIRQENWISVTSGLSAGDQLIADPAGLEEGDRIRITGEVELADAKGGGDGVH